MPKRRLSGVLIALSLAALLAAACGPSDPVEEVAKTRARYSARLNGFYVKAEPTGVEPGLELGEEAAAAEASTEAGPEELEGEEGAEEATPEPLSQDALLDIIVQHDSNTKLPGVTLDIVMVDAAQQEKGRWLFWVDTSQLEKANQLQLTYTIEDVPYVEGDGFSVEVRKPIPAAEHGEYQEFSVGG